MRLGKLILVEILFQQNKKFAIVTEMKKGNYIPPYFVESNKITSLSDCEIFDLTKAQNENEKKKIKIFNTDVV